MLFPEFKNILIFDMYPLIIRARESNMGIGGCIQLINTVGRHLKTPWNIVYCCFDSHVSERKALYNHYKENRHEMHESDDIKHLQEKLTAKGYIVLEFEGLEADDIIAQICCDYPDANKIVVSNDEDLFQLLNKNVTLYRYIGGYYEIFGYHDFINQYKINPSDWVTVKALAGCTSDNIEGVKGIGEKKAIECILHSPEKIQEHQQTIDKNLPLVKLPFRTVSPIPYRESLLWIS